MRNRSGNSVPAAIIAAAILILVCGVLAAADPVPVSKTIDLALPLHTDWSVPDNAKITLILIHKIPQPQQYDFRYQTYTLNPAQIETGNLFKAEQAKKPGDTPGEQPPSIQPPQPCVDVTNAANEMTTGSEQDVEGHVVAMQTKLAAAGASGCADEARARALIADTTQTIDISSSVPSLGADEGIIVTITRLGGPTPIPPSWILDIHTGTGNGRFLSNYTFGFALNRDKSYFATTDGSKIAEQSKRDKATMVPLVLFSWLPRNRATNSWIPSWTAGLGYDLSNPVVAAGAIWTWNRNLGIAVGLLGQKQQRLKGKYHIGDAVAANSESKDLTDPTWGPNVFVGISIRSVSALFK